MTVTDEIHVEAFDIGFNFLEDVLDHMREGENAIGFLAKKIGYIRDRAAELLNNPERLRLTEIVRIAKKLKMGTVHLEIKL